MNVLLPNGRIVQINEPFINKLDKLEDNSIQLPLSGTISQLLVNEGSAVKKGQLIGSLNAMKMEVLNRITIVCFDISKRWKNKKDQWKSRRFL